MTLTQKKKNYDIGFFFFFFRFETILEFINFKLMCQYTRIERMSISDRIKIVTHLNFRVTRDSGNRIHRFEAIRNFEDILRSCRSKKVSERDVRHVVKTRLTAPQAREQTNLIKIVSVSTIQCTLRSNNLFGPVAR